MDVSSGRGGVLCGGSMATATAADRRPDFQPFDGGTADKAQSAHCHGVTWRVVQLEIPPAARVRAAPDVANLSRAVSIRGWSSPSVSEADPAAAASSCCLFSASFTYNSPGFTVPMVAQPSELARPATTTRYYA
jgi:hypothetical protein